LAKTISHRKAIHHLKASDPVMAGIIEQVGPYRVQYSEPTFHTLAEAILYQQLNGKAAATIFARVKALGTNGNAPTPQEMLRIRKPALRRAGLSGAKILAMKDLAKKTIEAVVPTLEQAQQMSDEELVERLVSVRGIGAWTVEMFLIFRLGRPDVLPIHDYGVQKGFALTYGKKEIPKPRELAAFGERWRPYRTVASWYMWRAVEHYGKTRKITKSTKAKKRGKPAKKSSKKSAAKKHSIKKKASRAKKRS